MKYPNTMSIRILIFTLLAHSAFAATRTVEDKMCQSRLHELISSEDASFGKLASTTTGQDFVIVGIIDGPLPGGTPKAIEFYTLNDVSDASSYSVANANNGGSFATALSFPAKSFTAGDRFHIASEDVNFTTFFGTAPDTVLPVALVNGDDVFGLFHQGTLVDVYGDPGVDGTGTPWEYKDGWAYRNDSTGPNPVFTLSEWTFSGVDALDGSTSNTTANPPFPYETYNLSSGGGGGGGSTGGIPNYNIADVRGTDPATGDADSLNVLCRLRGTVFTIDFRGGNGISFWIKDHTAGINVFNFNDVSNYTVAVGDSIEIVGSIAQYNGLTEIIPDTITLISSGNTLSNPVSVSGPLDESYEGSYLQLNNVSLVNPSQWPTAGNSANVDVSDGSNTYLVRINSATDIDGATPPSGLFNLRGAGSQYDNSSPYTGGYQIQPSSMADFISNNPTSPTVNFASATQDAIESAGTVAIQINIYPPAAAAGVLDLSFIPGPGAGTTPQDASTIPAVDTTTGLLSMNFSAGDSILTIQGIIVDDQLQEGNESVTLSVVNVTGGVSVGPISSMVFTIIDNDIPIPTYNIADIRGVNTNGELDSIGVYCKVEGLVLGYNVQSATGTNAQFTVQDATSGISIYYSLNNVPYSPIEGDRVRIVGTVADYNGLAEIFPDSITVISSGNTLPNPLTVTALDESTESNLIRIDNVTLVDATQWPAPGNNGNVDLSDGVNTYVMRIDRDTDVDDNVAPPVTAFDVVGIGGQFDNSAPYTDGYQILPRYAQDIRLPAPPTLAITEIMSGSNTPSANLNGDWWELTNTGTDPIDISGFSYDDNSFNAGTVTFPTQTIAGGASIVIWDGLSADEDAFRTEWLLNLSNPPLIILSSDEVSGNMPGLSQNGDAVAIYADNGAEICRAEYTNAQAGVSIEFDASCLLIRNSADGVNGAYTSTGGDVGSPGNLTPVVSVDEFELQGVSVYPNPTRDRLNIALKDPMTAEFMLINSLGVVLQEGIILNGQQTLDIEKYASGVYSLRVVQGEKSRTLRLLKNQ